MKELLNEINSLVCGKPWISFSVRGEWKTAALSIKFFERLRWFTNIKVRGRVAGDSVSDVGPASVMVGNIVQGNRLASAQGRDMGILDEDSDNAKKVGIIELRISSNLLANL